MSTELIIQTIKNALPELYIVAGEPMKNHCSFRIGGCAEIYAEPSGQEELKELIALLKSMEVQITLIGRGTNLLVSDEGVKGAVVRIGERLSSVSFEGSELYAQGGISLAQLAVSAQQKGLSGLEFAHGIPGSLGGAVFMNAGAYGGEMKDVVVSVRYLDENGNILESEDNGFSYRRSKFSEGKCLIIGAGLRLSPDDPAEIKERMRSLMDKRSASQPLDRPSAGSTFKRPATGYAAAMIDGAGLKGVSVGGAQVSEKHAGFIINTGNASCRDVLELMKLVQEKVFEKYGVMLEPEVRLIG